MSPLYCRSHIDPSLIGGRSEVRFPPRLRPDWFLYGSWIGVGNERIFVIHPPTAIQELIYFYLRLGVSSSLRPFWYVDDHTPEPHGIVVSYHCLVVEADGPVDIKPCGHPSPCPVSSLGRDAKSAVVLINKVLVKEAISRVHIGNLPELHLSDKPILEHPEEPLNPPLGQSPQLHPFGM